MNKPFRKNTASNAEAIKQVANQISEHISLLEWNE